jgi:hypothetical protein
MRAWYCPSWNGDLRLEPDPDAPRDRTRLSIVKPTAEELDRLAKMGPVFLKKEWVSRADSDRMVYNTFKYGWGRKTAVVVRAPIEDVGPVVTSLFQPGPAVITAVRFSDGRIEVAETSQPATRPDTDREPAKDRARELPPPEPKSEPSEAAKALAKKEGAEAAATVKRATPCCPDCYADSCGPATEVLLSFLDEEQHGTWSRERFVVVRGGLSGHRYVVAHRNSPVAVQNRRHVYDLDDRGVMHFHNWLVPPEEEVLAAMLILQFREPWLRNEATCLGPSFGWRHTFKNPFGGGGDGMADSSFTAGFGHGFLNALRGAAEP